MLAATVGYRSGSLKQASGSSQVVIRALLWCRRCGAGAKELQDACPDRPLSWPASGDCERLFQESGRVQAMIR